MHERFPLSLTYQELPMGHRITAQSLNVVTTWLSAGRDALDGSSAEVAE